MLRRRIRRRRGRKNDVHKVGIPIVDRRIIRAQRRELIVRIIFLKAKSRNREVRK